MAQEQQQSSAEEQLRAGQRYVAESKWCGIFGGWGSEGDISAIANRRADQGYRLISTKVIRAMWFYLLPRPKLLMLFEREPS